MGRSARALKFETGLRNERRPSSGFKSNQKGVCHRPPSLPEASRALHYSHIFSEHSWISPARSLARAAPIGFVATCCRWEREKMKNRHEQRSARSRLSARGPNAQHSAAGAHCPTTTTGMPIIISARFAPTKNEGSRALSLCGARLVPIGATFASQTRAGVYVNRYPLAVAEVVVVVVAAAAEVPTSRTARDQTEERS